MPWEAPEGEHGPVWAGEGLQGLPGGAVKERGRLGWGVDGPWGAAKRAPRRRARRCHGRSGGRTRQVRGSAVPTGACAAPVGAGGACPFQVGFRSYRVGWDP